MSRRILSVVTILWMLAALTGFPQVLDDEILRSLAAFYFLGLLFLQFVPVVMTHNGNFGHRLHPVNVMYGILSCIGIFGTVLLFAVFWKSGGAGMTIVAGSMLFLGVVGSAVLALFAKPWDDWAFKRRESEYLERIENRPDTWVERGISRISDFDFRGRNDGSD